MRVVGHCFWMLLLGYAMHALPAGAGGDFAGRITVQGEPAAGAKITYHSDWHFGALQNGHLVHQGLGMFHSAEANAQGDFELDAARGDPCVFFIRHASGYAWLPQYTLADQAQIALQPWGRVEGTAWRGGQPLANQTIELVANPYLHELFPWRYTTETDEQGRFVFAQVPAGQPAYLQAHHIMPIDIQPGETTTVRFAAQGVTLTGQLQAAGEGWSYAEARVMLTNFTRDPIEYPEGLSADPYDRIRWGLRWLQSAKGQEAIRNWRRYRATVNASGRFSFDGVQPGTYAFFAVMQRGDAETKQVARLYQTVTIEPAAASPVNMGTATLKVKTHHLDDRPPVNTAQ